MISDTSSRTIDSASTPTFVTAMPSAKVEPPSGRLSPVSAFQNEG
jgi:hypothetical protein